MVYEFMCIGMCLGLQFRVDCVRMTYIISHN